MWRFLLNSKIGYVGVVLFLALLHYFFYGSEMTRGLDYTLYDVSRGVFEDSPSHESEEKNASNNTVIVNIDEKSLQSIGQWPWSRNRLAELVDDINSMNPANIAINMIFPELDRSSPVMQSKNSSSNIGTPWNGLSVDKRDYDQLFMNAIQKSHATLSVYLHSRDNMSICEKTLSRNLRFQYLSNKIETKSSILCNHQVLQKSVTNFGFINLEVDEDSFLRRASFFMSYKGVVIPSFALATLFSLDKNIAIDDHSKIHFLDHYIEMNDDMKVLLNFNNSRPKMVSATDALHWKLDPNIFKGKIVLIGLSIVGLNNIYPISKDIKMSNMEVQATFIENVLDETLLVQPKVYQKINILISFLFSCLLLYFLSKRYYILTLGAIPILVIGTFLYLSLFYFEGTYVSLGYFWMPFSRSFLFIAVLFVGIYIIDKNRSYGELQKSHNTTVESISLVAGMREGETGEHIWRTKNYVKVLAEYLYEHHEYRDILTPNYISCLYEATPLYDIGKVELPDTVRKKEGKFTPQEYITMQEHPLLAKAIIEKAMKFYDKNSFLEMSYNVAYYHHERWNGTGYPLGLKEEEIPLEAQLVGLADVYDALVSKCSYKKSYRYDKVEQIIMEGQGLEFNPILVDAFIELKDKFREIHKLWEDK